MKKLPRELLGLTKETLEDTCHRCGLCCYSSVKFDKGNIFLPELRCRHLEFDENKKSCCNVYENRHEVTKGWCLPLVDAIEKGVFPDNCPYVKDVKDYVGTAVLSEEAYQMVRPTIQKALAEGGKPEWVNEDHWNEFLKK